MGPELVLTSAVIQDQEMDQRRLFTNGVFVLGSFLSGLAGAEYGMTTVMDTTVIVEAFVVSMLGAYSHHC